MFLQLDQKIRMRTMNICLSVSNPRQIKYTLRSFASFYSSYTFLRGKEHWALATPRSNICPVPGITFFVVSLTSFDYRSSSLRRSKVARNVGISVAGRLSTKPGSLQLIISVWIRYENVTKRQCHRFLLEPWLKQSFCFSICSNVLQLSVSTTGDAETLYLYPTVNHGGVAGLPASPL